MSRQNDELCNTIEVLKYNRKIIDAQIEILYSLKDIDE